MDTQLETLTKPQLIVADHHLPRDVGDGLVLRFATPADVEALAQFNGHIHGSERPDHFDPMVAAWTPNAVLLVIGLYLLSLRSTNREPFKISFRKK